MAIDSRAEPEPTGRGYVNGSGHGGGHGGAPPPSLERRVGRVEDRQEVLEDKFDKMIDDVRAVTKQAIDLQAMTIRLDVEGKRRDIEARDVKKAIEGIAKKLDHTAEDTGQFRINAAMQQAGAATAKAKEEADQLRAELAIRDERARHYTRWTIGLIGAVVVAVIVFALTH